MKINLKGKTLQAVINECKLKPRRHHILVSLNFSEPESAFELEQTSNEDVDQYQYVIAAGDNTEYEVGDRILLDMAKLVRAVPDEHDRTKVNYVFDVTPVRIGEHELAILSDNSVLAKEIDYPVIDLKS